MLSLELKCIKIVLVWCGIFARGELHISCLVCWESLLFHGACVKSSPESPEDVLGCACCPPQWSCPVISCSHSTAGVLCPLLFLFVCVCISWLMMDMENENGVWELLFGVLVRSESSNGILAQLVQWNVHPAYEEMNGCLRWTLFLHFQVS